MLKKESTSAMSQRPVTLKDVEEGAVNLRKVGEALATLKGNCICTFRAYGLKSNFYKYILNYGLPFISLEVYKIKCATKTFTVLTRVDSETYCNYDIIF